MTPKSTCPKGRGLLAEWERLRGQWEEGRKGAAVLGAEGRQGRRAGCPFAGVMGSRPGWNWVPGSRMGAMGVLPGDWARGGFSASSHRAERALRDKTPWRGPDP